MIKYCLVDSDLEEDLLHSVGIKQWVNAFNGVLITVDALLVNDYDLVHVRLTQKNLELIAQLKQYLKKNTRTKLVVSLDMPVEQCAKEYFDPSLLSDVVSMCDHIFATEYSIAQYLQALSSQPIYELAHPADLAEIHKKKTSKKQNTLISILADTSSGRRYLMQSFRIPLFLKRPALMLFSWVFRCQVSFLPLPKSQNQEKDFIEQLSSTGFVLSINSTPNYGKEAIWSAALETIVIGNSDWDAQRRCFPYTANETLREAIRTFIWLRFSAEARQFIRQNASSKVEYYNLENSKQRLLDQMQVKVEQEVQGNKPDRIYFKDRIIHISGLVEVSYAANEFAVYCLEKNAAEYLPSFLEHYRKLGAKHFFFVDNGSTDDTLSILKNQTDITIYHTDLKHWIYENEIRRYLVTKHGTRCWCLCVDIDELFEFPYSNKILMSQLLDYLTRNQYTSVVAHMLDMFATNETVQAQSLEKAYPYFDLSGVKEQDYASGQWPHCNYNELALPQQKIFYGGIRQQFVKNQQSKFLLVKHPLLYIDHKIEPFTTPHYSNKTKVADITCALKHYKLTASLQQRIKEGKDSESYSYMIKDEVEAYAEMSQLDQNPVRDHAKRFNHVNELIAMGFISVSSAYVSMVHHLENPNLEAEEISLKNQE